VKAMKPWMQPSKRYGAEAALRRRVIEPAFVPSRLWRTKRECGIAGRRWRDWTGRDDYAGGGNYLDTDDG